MSYNACCTGLSFSKANECITIVSKCETIFIEYIMLDGVNDQEEHAHKLGKLLENFKAVVNLIPFNPIGSASTFKTSSDQSIKKFQKVLRGIYSIRTTVRQEMGQDIAGACGQLVVSLPDERSAGGATLLSDIEDLRI
uniref:Ribosomal RNA large subunit methyltransferase N n=1 Tax=Aegilops tauschii subsp. strangulata TaxID=200361 RepID=A0A453IPP1_AEGTS